MNAEQAQQRCNELLLAVNTKAAEALNLVHGTMSGFHWDATKRAARLIGSYAAQLAAILDPPERPEEEGEA